jgi:hypothetical protein
MVWTGFARGSVSGGGCMAGTLPGPRGGPAGRDIGSTGVWRSAALAGAAQTALRRGGAPRRQPDARQHGLRGGVRRRPADRGCGVGWHQGPPARRNARCGGNGRCHRRHPDRTGRRYNLRRRHHPSGRVGHSRGKHGVCAEDDRAEGAFRAQANRQWRAEWRRFGSGGFSGGVF